MYTRNFGVESDGELFKMQQEAFNNRIEEHTQNIGRSAPVQAPQSVKASPPPISDAFAPAMTEDESLRPGRHEFNDALDHKPESQKQASKGLLSFDFKNILNSIKFDDILLILIVILLLMDDGNGDDNNDELLLVLAILFVMGFNN